MWGLTCAWTGACCDAYGCLLVKLMSSCLFQRADAFSLSATSYDMLSVLGYSRTRVG